MRSPDESQLKSGLRITNCLPSLLCEMEKIRGFTQERFKGKIE